MVLCLSHQGSRVNRPENVMTDLYSQELDTGNMLYLCPINVNGGVYNEHLPLEHKRIINLQTKGGHFAHQACLGRT